MSTKHPQYLCERFRELQNIRSPHERRWREIAEHMRPSRLAMNAIYNPSGQPVEQSIYITSGVAQMALDNFVGGIYGYLSNEANAWASYKTFDDDLNKYHPVKEWLERVSRMTMNSYTPAVSRFYGEVSELYADAPAFGHGGFLSEWRPDRQGYHDKCYSPFDLYFDVDDQGNVDTVMRPESFTARQIVRKFVGEGKAIKDKDGLPLRLKNAKDGDQFMVLHVVVKNDEYSDGMIGPKGFPYTDQYLLLDDHVLLQDGGRYDTYQTPVWSGSGPYGFGIGTRVLPDAKTHNAMDRSMLEHAEWQAHPAPLMQDRNQPGMGYPKPRKPIYGGMSPGGRRLVDFLQPQGNTGVTFEMMQERAEMIRQGWFFGLMQLAGRSGMTTLEVMQRDETTMRLLGPHLGRILIGFLAPSVTQRFAMNWRAGLIPEPPPELKGHQLKVDYVSPMANAQKSAAAAGVLRLIDTTIAVSQIQPEAADVLDGDEALRVLGEGFSAPLSVVRSPEMIAQKRQAREQLALQKQALEMGQQGADIAQKLNIAHPRNMGQKAA